MILQEVPPPDEVRADLDDVLTMIWQALEVGAGSAVSFFTSHGVAEPDDRGLAAHLTRYQAKHVLDGLQQDAIFERDDLPFSGLLLRVTRNGRHYVIRIRRSMDGVLPPPQSSMMALFYWQPSQLDLPLEDGVPEPPPAPPEIHLMIVWSTNSDYSQITSVLLALPRVAEPDQDVETHWVISIPHPAITIAASSGNNTDGSSGSPAADNPDLNIGNLPDEGEQTGE